MRFGLKVLPVFLSTLGSWTNAWVPTTQPSVWSTRKARCITGINLGLAAPFNRSDRGENTFTSSPPSSSPTSTSTEVTFDTLEQLESELERMQNALKEQKGTHEQQLEILEQESRSKVDEARETMQAMVNEYESYKAEMMAKLEAAPSEQEAKRMQRELVELQERTDQQADQLLLLRKQLAENRKARQCLQVEMVALREGYLNRLAELDDALELEQNERTKEKMEASKKMDEIRQQFRQRLKDTVADYKRQSEQITANFNAQLAKRDEMLAESKGQLQRVEVLLEQRQVTLSRLESERQSLRKLMGATFHLLRKRLSRRFSKQEREQYRQEQNEREPNASKMIEKTAEV